MPRNGKSKERAAFEAKEGELPTIIVGDGNLHEAVDACMTIVAAHPGIYIRGTSLVRIERAKQLKLTRKLQVDDDRLLVTPVRTEWLTTELSRRARFEHYDRRAEEMRRVDIPARLAPLVIASTARDGTGASTRAWRCG